NADRPGGGGHGVFGLPSWSTHAGSVFHAGAANVSARPDVFAGFRCLTRVGFGPDACHPDYVDCDNAPDRKLFCSYLSRNRRRLPACLRSQALLDHRRLCSRCNYHPARDRTGVPRSTARTHLWPERARYVKRLQLRQWTVLLTIFRADPLLVIELVASPSRWGAWHDRTYCPCFFCASDERALSQ